MAKKKTQKKVQAPEGRRLKAIKTLGAEPKMGLGLRVEDKYYVEIEGKKAYMIESQFRKSYTFA